MYTIIVRYSTDDEKESVNRLVTLVRGMRGIHGAELAQADNGDSTRRFFYAGSGNSLEMIPEIVSIARLDAGPDDD